MMSTLRNPFCSLRARWMLVNLSLLVFAGSHQIASAQTVETLYAEAQAAKAKGDIPQAIEKLQAIIKLNPQLAPVYHNLGILYFEGGKLREAVKAFEDGLRVD